MAWELLQIRSVVGYKNRRLNNQASKLSNGNDTAHSKMTQITTIDEHRTFQAAPVLPTKGYSNERRYKKIHLQYSNSAVTSNHVRRHSTNS